MPDPVLSDDGHYQSFCDVFGTPASQKELPSAVNFAKKKKPLPFNVTQQHVKNVHLLIQCDDCEMWRLLFSKTKLSSASVMKLSAILEDISYTCGATLDDITLPDDLQSVCIRSHRCHDPVEKLYYSCQFPEVICFYCSTVLPPTTDTTVSYPRCCDCSKKPVVKRVKRGRK